MPEVPPQERDPESERPAEATPAPTPPAAPADASRLTHDDIATPGSEEPQPPPRPYISPSDTGDAPGGWPYPAGEPLAPPSPEEAPPQPRAPHSPEEETSQPRAPDEWQTGAIAAPSEFPVGVGGVPLPEEVAEGEATAAAPPAERRSIGSVVGRGVREVAETIILALLIFLLVRAVVQNFQVEGSSMQPTLQNGWYLLVNKAVYFEINLETVEKFLPFIDPGDDPTRYIFWAPGRGDVIVFKAPNQPPGQPERDFIKRIIGEPGETVEVRDHTVFIDGQPLDEPYVLETPNYTYGPEVVPPDHYFVLGDNRNNSSDSHVPSVGMVPKGNIIGKAWLAYWPFSDFGLVNNTSVEPGSGLDPEPEKEPAAQAPVAASP